MPSVEMVVSAIVALVARTAAPVPLMAAAALIGGVSYAVPRFLLADAAAQAEELRRRMSDLLAAG